MPFGWRALALDRDARLLRFAAGNSSDAPAAPDLPAALRLTLALEQPTTAVLTIESTDGREKFAQLDLRYGCVFQLFATLLPAATAARVRAEGARLRLLSGDPIAVFAPAEDQTDPDFPAEFAPHLLPTPPSPPASSPPAPATPDVAAPLASLACLQPFNWLHGCVVDALADLGDHAALARHLDRWFLPDGQLRYVGPHSEPRADELFGLEPVLMFAALLRHDPRHPAFAVLRRWLARHTEADGLIIDRGLDAEGIASPVTWISIEACYTVAYPLALAATAFEEPAWRDLAWQQITHRLRHLVRDGVICQRAPLGGPGEQPHWARANAWFLLGLVKTLRALGPLHPAALAEGLPLLRAHAARLLDAQRPDGLWSVYLDAPDTLPDTSASAGLAAALALAAHSGWLDADALDAARCADAALARHLTPDGFLGGVAQLNRGGDTLQRGPYRVLGQFGLGLYGQLRAALALFP